MLKNILSKVLLTSALVLSAQTGIAQVGDGGFGGHQVTCENGQLPIINDNGMTNFSLQEIYRETLGRFIDIEGHAFYTCLLMEGKITLEQIRHGVAGSAEAQDRVHDIYDKNLGRRADIDGLAFYINLLRKGHSLRDLENYIK